MKKLKLVTDDPELPTNAWDWFDSIGQKSKGSSKEKTNYNYHSKNFQALRVNSLRTQVLHRSNKLEAKRQNSQ